MSNVPQGTVKYFFRTNCRHSGACNESSTNINVYFSVKQHMAGDIFDFCLFILEKPLLRNDGIYIYIEKTDTQKNFCLTFGSGDPVYLRT